MSGYVFLDFVRTFSHSNYGLTIRDQINLSGTCRRTHHLVMPLLNLHIERVESKKSTKSIKEIYCKIKYLAALHGTGCLLQANLNPDFVKHTKGYASLCDLSAFDLQIIRNHQKNQSNTHQNNIIQALKVAGKYNDIEELKILIERYCSIMPFEIIDGLRLCAFQAAVEGHKEIIQTLLTMAPQHFPNLIHCILGRTLVGAARGCHISWVESLLSPLQQPKISIEYIKKAFLAATDISNNHDVIIELLSELDLPQDEKRSLIQRAILEATSRGDMDTARILQNERTFCTIS